MSVTTTPPAPALLPPPPRSADTRAFVRVAAAGVLGDTSLRVTSTVADAAVFVGLARPADAAAYLEDVQRSTVTEVEVPPAYTEHTGGAPAGDPRGSDIWTEQATGTGTQTIS